MNRIDMESLQRHFNQIGSNIELKIIPNDLRTARRQSWVDYRQGFTLDVHEGKDEVYVLSVNSKASVEIEFAVVNIAAESNHLLLFAKRNASQANGNATKSKFLCGFDERHWFAAELKSEAVTNVWTAMDALKPEEAKRSQQMRKVRCQHRQRRHNAGFVRQGEWFLFQNQTFFHNETRFCFIMSRFGAGVAKRTG